MIDTSEPKQIKDWQKIANATLVRATIERCAKVAEEMADKQYEEFAAKLICKVAAAIRELKE